MEQLLTNLAEASPVAVVALYSIYRISVVMIVLANALVAIASQTTENNTELITGKDTGKP